MIKINPRERILTIRLLERIDRNQDHAIITAEINGIYDLAQDGAEEQLTNMVEDLTGYTVEFI